jgi:prepilin-type N-terminal cleavage/methylation domain-containing protein
MNSYTTKHQRKAFTLLEVLISIALLGIIVVALFSTVSMMKDSNEQLYDYLQKAKKVTQATQVIYLDISSSDGNLTIEKDDLTRLCIEGTRNSLYALSLAKVCWVVLKKDNTLIRVEGNAYELPTRLEDRVEVNRVMKNVELFDVYHEKDKVLVALKQKGKEPINFMIQGIIKPKSKKVMKQRPNKNGTKTNVADIKSSTPGTATTTQTTPPATTTSRPGETPSTPTIE